MGDGRLVMNELGEFVDTTPIQPWERIVDAPKTAKYDKRTCPICGKEFEPHANNQKFCSEKCRRVRQVEMYTRHNEKRAEERRKRRERNR